MAAAMDLGTHTGQPLIFWPFDATGDHTREPGSESSKSLNGATPWKVMNTTGIRFQAIARLFMHRWTASPAAPPTPSAVVNRPRLKNFTLLILMTLIDRLEFNRFNTSATMTRFESL